MMAAKERLRFVADLLEEVWDLLAFGQKGDRIIRGNIEAWCAGKRAPTVAAVAKAARYLWVELLKSENKEVRATLFAELPQTFEDFEPNWTARKWASRLVKIVREARRELREAGKSNAKSTGGAPLAAHGVQISPSGGIPPGSLREQTASYGQTVAKSPAGLKKPGEFAGAGAPPSRAVPDSVVTAVNGLFEQAKLSVISGQVILDAELQLDLTPLYVYVASLQQSATIPSYFPGIPDIELDSLYVELCAAEDQRGLGMDSPASWEEADSVRADWQGLWRTAVAARSIPLATLISKTELVPTVVFGDPGTGKSTLTRYALHELGRCLVDPKRSLGIRVLPFRIALREFAEAGKSDQFSVLRHLARHHLRVPDATVDSWVTVLSYLFADSKPSRLFLLVDGIDEVTPASAGYDLIHRSLREVTSIARMLFTSRRAGFKSPVTRYEAFEVIDLSPLSIHAMIRNWFTVVTPRSPAFIRSLSRWVFADSRRQEMAANPCLLSLICFLNQDRPSGRFLQPRSRARLYELVVQKLMDAHQGPLPVSPRLLKAAVAAFALKRYRVEDDHRAPLTLFSELQLESFLLTWKPGGNLATSSLTAAEMLKTWRDLRLVFQWNLSGWHYFLHLTLQEYFAAQALFELSGEEFAQVADRHRYNPHWREVWRFYAGLCRSDSDSGRRRFHSLLGQFAAEPDLFGEVGFMAAPLCAEYRLLDTTAALRYDLKRVLYEAIRIRHRASMDVVAAGKARIDRESYFEMQEARMARDPQLVARVRIVVELEPDYFLEVARRAIQEYRFQRGAGRARVRRGNAVDRVDVLLASVILSSNYDQEALEFQAVLIREEASDASLEIADPPMGPLTASGRNEGLTEAIVEALSKAKSWLAKERLIRYLANTRDPIAAQSILAAAAREEKSTPRAAAFAFRVQCLNALCDLQDPAAVKLADELVRVPDLRAKYLDQICAGLALVKHPEVAELLERWLTEKWVPTNGMAFQHLLIELRQWREREVPVIVPQLIGDPLVDSALRVKAWDLLLSRTGSHGVTQLRERFRRDLDRHRLPHEEWQELASLAELVALNRLPMGSDLEELASRAPKRYDAVLQRIEGALLSWHAASPGMPDSHAWLVNEGIPRLKKVLQSCARKGAEVPWTWLEVFADCPVDILRQLAEMITELWPILESSVRAELMYNFARHPHLFPRSLLDQARDSEDDDLRHVAAELLLGTDPGRLVRERLEDPDVDRLLRDTAATSGILFFKDSLYSPTAAAFIPYSEPQK